MDIFEELFGDVLSHEEIGEMIGLRNLGLLRTSYKGDPKLKLNPEQFKVFTKVLKLIYKLAEEDGCIEVLPPDITPDTAFRIFAETTDISLSFKEKDILQEILPLISVFGVEIKDEDTLVLEFVIPDVYTYPFDEDSP